MIIIDLSAWDWPQWVILFMLLIKLVIEWSKFDKMKHPAYAKFGGLLGFVLYLFILSAGGFFG